MEVERNTDVTPISFNGISAIVDATKVPGLVGRKLIVIRTSTTVVNVPFCYKCAIGVELYLVAIAATDPRAMFAEDGNAWEKSARHTAS